MLSALAVAAAWAVAPVAVAAVTGTGDFLPDPLPAAGGNIAAPLLVGDTGVGTVTINGGTPLHLTAGSVTIGDDAAALGILTMTGLGSNLSTAVSNDVTIGNNGFGQATVSALAQLIVADDLFLARDDGASGRLVVQDLGTIVTVNDAVLVGEDGTGVIELTGGGRLLADDTVIGQTATADGRATVSGALSLWRQDNSMTVGDAGRGRLEVLDEGRMESTNVVIGNAATASGAVEVRGTGSVWEITGFVNAGISGLAHVRVLDGGRIANTGALRLATTTSGESRIEVSGAGSLWAAGANAIVGDFGLGVLDIRSGGRVTSTDARLGDTSTARGEATVDGAGSTWEITGTLDVAASGRSVLTISNGGLVTTTGVARVGAAGELVLGGGRLVAGSTGLTNNGLVRGGGRIDGAATNSTTGKIRIAANDALTFGSGVVNTGLVDLDGGEVEVLGTTMNSGDIDARDATLRFNGNFVNSSFGQLAATGGGVDVYGGVMNSSNAQIAVVSGASAVFHDMLTNHGNMFVAPGSRLTTLESLTLGGESVLTLQLGADDAASSFSKVEAAGVAILNTSTLEVVLAGDYQPALGDSFTVLSAGVARSGFFLEDFSPLGGGLDWEVDYSPTTVTLSVVASPFADADFDEDGDVDGNDLADWETGFGTSPGAEKDDGDADLDGDVDGADFLTWQRQVSGTLLAPATQPVPEPAGAALAAVALAAVGLRRRRVVGPARQAGPGAGECIVRQWRRKGVKNEWH